MAREARADAAVFSRDQDGDSDRMERVEDGLQRARALFPALAGGVAVPCVEAWLLALRGDRNSERRDAKARFGSRPGVADEIAALIEHADLHQIPDDAASIAVRLERVRAVLAPSPPRP